MLLLQFTGLSGAGKTTLANSVARLLVQEGIDTEVLDGDVYRATICKDLGFSKADRQENIRRLGLMANSFSAVKQVAIIAAINPYEANRNELEMQFGAKTVWIHCTKSVLVQRDTKGLYKRFFLPKNHPQKVNNLTGMDDVYEPPPNADLVVETHLQTEAEASQMLHRYILTELCLALPP